MIHPLKWLLLGAFLTQACAPTPNAPSETDAAPQRIVCGTPAVAELVFALGAGDRVVGISEYTTYPPEALTKARIGGWINPNRERLLVLQPDLIITQGRHDALANFANEYGIAFESLHIEQMSDIPTAVQRLAALLQTPTKAQEVLEQLDANLQRITEKTGGQSTVRVLLVMSRATGGLGGLTTAGPNTFLNELVELAGGTNIFADAKGPYPQVSKESLLLRQPDVILEFHPEGLSDSATARLRADWDVLSQLPAVRNDRIAFLTGDHLLVPGPRVAQTAYQMARALHPEVFADE